MEHAAQRELPQMYPRDGWVEHDPREIWNATRDVCSQILSRDDVSAENVAAIGITNQRETTVLWDRGSGQPLHNAIVWQDRRTADTCRKFKESGYESMVQKKTGLLIDPYFSASKIAWLLDAVPGARTAAKSGTLAFGTIDCFLLWHLTGGRVHATDASNAARTMLFNIHSQAWDQDLLQLFDIPKEILPEVLDCSGLFGVTDRDSFGAEIPITGMAGDQQAAAFGQACFQPGMIKSTYGTGCFVLLNTGNEAIPSNNRLLSTVAYRLKGKTTYAVEGSIFIAGAAIQWLRDGLGVISHAADSEALARGIDHTGGVYLVPAFTGLGAPYWDPAARGAIFGLTRDSGVSELVRAALESVCYQTRDLMDAMRADGVVAPKALRVDGGMAANDWLMQFLADVLDVPVERPAVIETTALGAAYLAGLGAGIYSSLEDISDKWKRDHLFDPAFDSSKRERLYEGWRKAVERIRTDT